MCNWYYCAKLSFLLFIFLFSSSLIAADFYTEPEVFQMRPKASAEKHFGHVGVTGLVVRVYKGVVVKVERVEPNTPASGKFKKGDTITAVNGISLKGKNPFVALGNALLKAESTNGQLQFQVGNSKKVNLKIPVLGKYVSTWPLNCGKSQKIVQDAAVYYSSDPEFKSNICVDGVSRAHLHVSSCYPRVMINTCLL